MVNIDNLVNEWAYRCKKGYPDMDSPSDLRLLKVIFKEQGISLSENLSAAREAPNTSQIDTKKEFFHLLDNEDLSPKNIEQLSALAIRLDPTHQLDEDEEEDKEALDEYGGYMPLAQDGLHNTANALSQLVGLPMTTIIPLLVFGIPITYMLTLEGIELIQKYNVPGFIKNIAKKAISIFQKSGKSGEAISSEVEALQSKGEKQVADALGSAEGMNESLDNFTDDQKMKFIKDFNAKDSGMMNESVKTRRNKRKLNESRQLKARFRKLANIIK